MYVDLDMLKEIKMIIWDLDECFWGGTLSEGDIVVSADNIELVKKLSARGIVCSICSKNDFDAVFEKMKEIGIWEYFVFPSINWENKGPRIHSIINKAQLREENVLFIDDNNHNLQEANFYCNGNLLLATPEIIATLKQALPFVGKDDTDFSRLKQYKILEEKDRDYKIIKDESDFLKSSNIVIEINSDCKIHIDRIYELINRAHQLNYTKQKITKEELEFVVSSDLFETRYIIARDKYGDYGIIGFYALDIACETLVHYVFSCRVLGMHIEQFVYKLLGYPTINVINPVTVELQTESSIDYITCMLNTQHNDCDKRKEDSYKTLSKQVLLKGPCDLDSVAYYLGDKNVSSEFGILLNDGCPLTIGSHSAILERSLYGSKQSDTKLVDKKIYDTKIGQSDIKVLVLSTIINAQMGEYEDNNGERVVFGEWKYDATTESGMKDFLCQKAFSGFNYLVDKDFLDFRERYSYIGRESPEVIVERYRRIVSYIGQDCDICFILGSETAPENEFCYSLIDGNLFFKRLNYLLKEEFKNDKNVAFIDVNNYIDGTSCLCGSINHYSRDVYYRIAKEISMLYGSFLVTDSANYFRGAIRFFPKDVRHLCGLVLRKIGIIHK